MQKSEQTRSQDIAPKFITRVQLPQIRTQISAEVIDISSDEEVEALVISHPSPIKQKTTMPWAEAYPTNHFKARLRSAADDEVLELTDTSSDESEALKKKSNTSARIEEEVPSRTPISTIPWATSDPAIFVLDEPKGASKPLKSPTKTRNAQVPVPAGSSHAPSTPAKQKQVRKKSTPNIDANKETYARGLFETLNTTVFGNKLPLSTKLVWNKRLLTTAGRAKYRKHRDGTELCEIELAPKILDCEERIRFTLSHEMCHLATWIIDRNTQEAHGPRFKFWANQVMKLRADIVINTRHNYEINHPYQWKCQECGRIYGRFSKSIKPSEVRCGACKTGKLEPMFKTRQTRNRPVITGQVKRDASSLQQPNLQDEDITDDGEDLEELMNKMSEVVLEFE